MSPDIDLKGRVPVDFPVPQNGDAPKMSVVSVSDGDQVGPDDELMPSLEEVDVALREATGGFPEWIASFIRRVILLFDNLPEEAGGSSEGILFILPPDRIGSSLVISTTS